MDALLKKRPASSHGIEGAYKWQGSLKFFEQGRSEQAPHSRMAVYEAEDAHKSTESSRSQEVLFEVLTDNAS